MPNHIQGILEIASGGLAQHAAPLQDPEPERNGVRHCSLSVIVRSFKAEVTRRAHAEFNWRGEIWQRNYYDRVIRDGREFAIVTRYIAENPLMWTTSKTPTRKRVQHAAPLQRRTSR